MIPVPKLLALVSAIHLLAPPTAAAAESPPNFVFIAIDDLNDFCDYASEEPANLLQTIYPDPKARAEVAKSLTPNLDRPTVCALAGMPVPQQVQGTNLTPLITTPADPDLHDEVLMTYLSGNYSLRTPEYRFIR